MHAAMMIISSAPFAVVKKMLNAKPETLFLRSREGCTAIQSAVHRPKEEFKELLDMLPTNIKKDELNASTLTGCTAVDRAAKYGFHDNLKSLLECQADLEPQRDDDGSTPLLSACRSGYPLCCELLLEHGANVHAVTLKKQTALHLALEPFAPLGNPQLESRVRVLQCVVAAKANPSCVDDAGQTAIQVAHNTGFIEALRLLQAMGLAPRRSNITT